jgi:LEA14-like dessication related protein
MQRFISSAGSKWAIFLLMVIWISGCRQPQAPEYFGFRDIEFIKATGSQPTLATIVKLYNPNPFTVRLKHADVDVSINGRHVGHSTLDSTIIIPRRDTFYVPVAVQVDIKAILSNVMQTLLHQQATIGLDGHVRIGYGLLTFRRPFHYEGKEDLTSLMQSGLGL